MQRICTNVFSRALWPSKGWTFQIVVDKSYLREMVKLHSLESSLSCLCRSRLETAIKISDPVSDNLSSALVFSMLQKFLPKIKENKYRKDTKYWCNQCRIFIHNNLVSKKNHEQSQQHLKSVQRELRMAYKSKPNHEDNKVQVKKKADIKDYGFGNPITDLPTRDAINTIKSEATVNNSSEFQASSEFQQLNQPIVHSTKVGEWEQVVDKQELEQILGSKESPPPPTLIMNVEVNGPLALKRVEIDIDDNNNDAPLEFKKIKKRNFRK